MEEESLQSKTFALCSLLSALFSLLFALMAKKKGPANRPCP
jgi:hypothetical protein